MNSRRILTLLFIATLATGCDKLKSLDTAPVSNGAAATEARPTFQMITAKDGQLYRLNTQTGELHAVTEEGLKRLSTDWVTLEVGSYYKMADATGEKKFLKYLGNGQFEPSAWAIKPE